MENLFQKLLTSMVIYGIFIMAVGKAAMHRSYLYPHNPTFGALSQGRARFFAQKLFGGRRGGAMAVSYALFFGALALLAALIVPQLVQSVTTFAGRLGAYEETIRGLLVWVQNTFGIDTATAEQLVQMVGTALQNWFGGLSRSAARAAADFVSGAAGAAGNAVVALAASIYLLSGKEALLRAARACLHAALPPRAAGSVLEICRLANKIFSGYIGGQLVDALLVGGETFALMSIFGLEYAPLLSVLVGVTNIVPVLGPFLGAVPGLIILLLELPWKAAEFAIIIFVVQQVDGNFIAPRILGGATGLPGLGVLLAIVVGGAWFGIPGMVLGVPQTLRYFEQMQERIVSFVTEHSKITARRFTQLMHNTGELVMDMGTVLDGHQAVEEGLIDELGGLRDALGYLYKEIEK